VPDHHGARFPGQTILSCRGPQIGKPCQRKQDCDVACFCGAQQGPLDPRARPAGPPDGTRGHTGVCGGTLQAGVWMCQINDKGLVSRMIID
jgi:hypothetical protein